MSEKRNIVISADHRGDCITTVNFDEEFGSKKITIESVVRELGSRAEIVAEIQAQLKTLYNSHRQTVDVLVINNKELDDFVREELRTSTVCRYHHCKDESKLPEDNAQALYRLSCALNENTIRPGKYTDEIEMELSQISDTKIIDSHLMRCLVFVIEKAAIRRVNYSAIAAKLRR